MLNKTHSIFKLTTLATAVAISCQLMADGFAGNNRSEVDLEDYACEDCPELLPWEFYLTTNLGYLDNESRRFRRYTGIEDGAQLYLDGLAIIRDEDGFQWRTDFHNLGLDSGGLTSSLGVQGLYNVTFKYQSTIATDKDFLRSPFTQTGNRLVLPANWQPSNDATSFNGNTFNKLFDVVDGMAPKTPAQSGGGRVDYKRKYEKSC